MATLRDALDSPARGPADGWVESDRGLIRRDRPRQVARSREHEGPAEKVGGSRGDQTPACTDRASAGPTTRS